MGRKSTIHKYVEWYKKFENQIGFHDRKLCSKVCKKTEYIWEHYIAQHIEFYLLQFWRFMILLIRQQNRIILGKNLK